MILQGWNEDKQEPVLKQNHYSCIKAMENMNVAKPSISILNQLIFTSKGNCLFKMPKENNTSKTGHV